MCSTSCRMDCCDDRSACRRSTALFPLVVVISLRASSPLARSRQTITTVASICASASAVAFPIPELAPVTMQIFPCILLVTGGMMRSFQKVCASLSPLRAQPKRRVLVGDQEERVGKDPVVPPDDPLHEIEHPPGVVPGEQDSEPGDDHHHHHRDVQEREHDVVR